MLDYSVSFEGEKVLILNDVLAEEQGVTEAGLSVIKSLHKHNLEIQEAFSVGQMSSEEYVEEWTKTQFDLQEAWGFPMNAKFHRFWEMKGCTCPRMDNEDNYPHGFYTYSGSCKVHEIK